MVQWLLISVLLLTSTLEEKELGLQKHFAPLENPSIQSIMLCYVRLVQYEHLQKAWSEQKHMFFF